MERLRYLRLTGRQRVGVWLSLLALTLLAAALSLLWHLKPVMTSMAMARVSNMVNRIVSAAVNEAVESGEIDYGNFVIFDKDETGHITALRSNVAEVNRMQGRIADEILLRLSEVSTSELEIPLGTLTGSALLAGRGPSLYVRPRRRCKRRSGHTGGRMPPKGDPPHFFRGAGIRGGQAGPALAPGHHHQRAGLEGLSLSRRGSCPVCRTPLQRPTQPHQQIQQRTS